MYRIYSTVGDKTICLHDDTVDSSRVKVGDPQLTLEDSAAGSLTFTLYPNNIAYGGYDYSETEAGATTYLDTINLTSSLSQGALDNTGAEVVSSYTVRSDLKDIPDGVTAFTYHIEHLDRTEDVTSSMAGPSDAGWYVSDYVTVGEHDNDFKVTVTAPISGDISDDLYQGAQVTGEGHDITERELSYSTVSTAPFVYGGTRGDSAFDLEFEFSDDTQLSDIQYRLVVYADEDEHQQKLYIAASNWRDGDSQYGKFAYWENGNSYAVLEIRRKDGEDIYKSSISSITFEHNILYTWSMTAYDSDHGVISSYSSPRSSGSRITWRCDGQAYMKFSIKQEENWPGTYAELVTGVEVAIAPEIEKRFHLYSSDATHMGATPWSQAKTDSLGLSDISKIRMEIRSIDQQSYSPSNISLLNATPITIEREEIEKTVDYVERMSSRITVKRLEKDAETGKFVEKTIWSGRVIQESTDFYGNRAITCEGELAYLNDTCQPQAKYPSTTVEQFISGILEVHNSKVPDWKKFYLGQAWCTDTDTVDRQTTYKKTMEVLSEIFEAYGGHIRLRHADDGMPYIDWFSTEFDEATPVVQTINFGKNLLDFKCDWDMSELSTVLLPTGNVTSESGSTSVGQALELNNGDGPTPCQLLYQDADGYVQIEASPDLVGYKTAVAKVWSDKTYYFSGRLHGGYVAYVIKSNPDGTGDYFEGGTKIAGRSGELGFVDFVDYKITMPHYDEPHQMSVVMCSFGDGIQLALKEEAEGLDAYLTIEDCPDDGTWHTKGSLYIVNQEAVNKYGWIENQLALESMTTKEELYEAAKQYLQQGQFDHMTLELSAIDLNHLGIDAEYFDILDHVRVISEPHGLDETFPVTRIDIPLDKPAEMKITIGTTMDPTFTGGSNQVNQDILDQMEMKPSYPTVIDLARKNALEVINDHDTSKTAVITYIQNEHGEPTEMLIVNRNDIPADLDYDAPTCTAPMWRWNMNGLAYLTAGFHSTSDQIRTGITRDGQIVAMQIYANYLAGVTLQGCVLISGGLSDRPDIYRRIRIENGYISFEENSDGSYTPTGDIRSDISVNDGTYDPDTGEPILKNGLGIHCDIICLDSDGIWVKKTSTSGDGYAGAKDYSFICMDNNGHRIELEFMNGILINHTDLDED